MLFLGFHQSMSLVSDHLSTHSLVHPLASCTAATNSLNLSWTAASLCIMPQLCCILLMSTSTVLHQVAFGCPLFPSGVHAIGCFSYAAGVSSEHTISLFPALKNVSSYYNTHIGQAGLCYYYTSINE